MANPIITRIQVENNDVVSFLNGTTPPYTYVRSMSQILPQNPTYISYRYDSITISQVGGEAFTFTVYTITQVGGNSFTALNFQDPATTVQAKTVEIYRLLVTSIFKGCCECGNTEPECSIQYTYGSGGSPGQFDYTSGFPGLIRFNDITGNNQDFSSFFPLVQDGSWVFLFSKTDPTTYIVLQLANYTSTGGGAAFDAIELNANGTPFVEGTQFCVDFTSVGGSLVQGWQDTLNINPNLNQDNTVDGGGYDFVFDNNSSFTINGPGGSLEVDSFGPSMNAGTQQILVTAGYIDINTPLIGSASPGWVLSLTASGHVEYAPAATGTVSSVGLSMPSAFTVTNSPVISSGTLTVTGAGTSGQYIDGTGSLRTFPTIPSPQGLQDVITVDPVLTTNNTITFGSNNLNIYGQTGNVFNYLEFTSGNASIGASTIISSPYSNISATARFDGLIGYFEGSDFNTGNYVALRVDAGNNQLQLVTPNVNLANASNGQVLTLVNSITGAVEFTTINPGTGTVSSVGLSMPSAFTVTNSPIISSGTLTVTGSGTSAQYIDGTGALQNFPALGVYDSNQGIYKDTVPVNDTFMLGAPLGSETSIPFLIDRYVYTDTFKLALRGNPTNSAIDTAYGAVLQVSLDSSTTGDYAAAIKADTTLLEGKNIGIVIDSSNLGMYIESASESITTISPGLSLLGTTRNDIYLNQVVETARLIRDTVVGGGSPSVGFGNSLVFGLNDNNSIVPGASSNISSYYSNVTTGLESTDMAFSVTTANGSGPLAPGIKTVLTLRGQNGEGQIQFNEYGQTPANFPASPVWALGVDSSGNVIEFTPSTGGTYDSNQGIYKNTTLTNDTFQLGYLTEADSKLAGNEFSIDRHISTGTNRLDIRGVAPSNDGVLYVSNESTSSFASGILSINASTTVASSKAIEGQGVNGTGVAGTTKSSSAYGGQFGTISTTRNTIKDVVNIFSTGLLGGQIGLGGDILYSITNDNSVSFNAGRIGYSATSVTSAGNAEESKFFVSTKESGTAQPIDRLEINSAGQLKLNQYTTATSFASASGSSVGVLNVDNAGNVFVGTGGGTGSVSSVGLSMPSAFTVTNSPVITSGTLTVTGAGTSGQYIDGTGALQTFPSLTGYVPYTGATQDVDLDTFKLSTKSVYITGTAGDGHLHMKHQSADATATGQSTVLWADSNGDIKWKNDGQWKTTLKTSSNTADRVYTFPDLDCTLVPTTRSISTTSPLTGGGDLSADRTISIPAATSSVNGYLTSTDWTNFNTAYTNRITSLTTNNTSGNATLSSNTLNVPNYALNDLGRIAISTANAREDDYAPSGWPGTSDRVKVIAIDSTNTNYMMSLGGLASPVAGRIVTIVNASTANNLIIIENLSTSSTAANRFRMTNNMAYFLLPTRSVTFIYDGTYWTQMSASNTMGLDFFDDCTGAGSTYSTGFTGGLGLMGILATGTGSGVRADGDLFGTYGMVTGSSATGYAFLSTQARRVGGASSFASNSTFPYLVVAKINLIQLGTALQDFQVVFGMNSAAPLGNTTQASGYNWYYNGSANSFWDNRSTASGGSPSSTVASPLAANTSYNTLGIYKPGGSNIRDAVYFYSTDGVTYQVSSKFVGTTGSYGGALTMGVASTVGTTSKEIRMDFIGSSFNLAR